MPQSYLEAERCARRLRFGQRTGLVIHGFLPVIRGSSLASTSCSEMDATPEASFRLADAQLARVSPYDSESNDARTQYFLRSRCLAGGGALAAPTYGVHRVLPKRQNFWIDSRDVSFHSF